MDSQGKAKGSKLFPYLLLILPGLIMAVSQPLFYKLIKHEDARHIVRDILYSWCISFIVGFLISIYPAMKLVRKNQPNDERFDQVVGLAFFIAFGNDSNPLCSLCLVGSDVT